jgi:cell wall-associated NlpC family hydrolase
MWKWLAGLALPIVSALVALALAAVGYFSLSASGSADAGADAAAAAGAGLGAQPTALAVATIPAQYLGWYMQAAATCPGLPWPVLAGIGEVETDHGRADLPGVRSGANYAGAEGPMQFEPATFALFATGPAQPLSPYDAADAIYTAAKMLCADGASGGSTQGIEDAVYAYNHAGWCVSEVLSWAAKYGTATTTVSSSGESVPVAEAISYAEAQIGKPYQWGGTGPGSFDCSGLVYEAYLHAGITIARTTEDWRQDGPVVPLSKLEPGDLVFFPGSDGTAQSPGHVVMVLGGGRVIQAPHAGTDVQIDPLSLSGAVVATRPSALPSQ